MFRFGYFFYLSFSIAIACIVSSVSAQTPLWNPTAPPDMGGQHLINAPRNQTHIAVAPAAPGTLFMAWKDNRGNGTPNPPSPNIYLSTVDTNNINAAHPGIGNPIHPSTGVQINPYVTADTTGFGVVTYQDDSSGTWKVFVQAVKNGQAQWNNQTPVPISTAPTVQTLPKIYQVDNKGWFVVWEDSTPSAPHGAPLAGQKVFVQFLNMGGNPVWASPTPISLTSGDQTNFSAVLDGSGGLIVTWLDTRNSQPNIYAQDINQSGVLTFAGQLSVPIVYSPYSAEGPVAVSNGNGGAIIAFAAAQTNDTNIYAQSIDANGNLLWNNGSNTNPVTVCSANGVQTSPTIISDDSNGAIIAWQDQSSPRFPIYAQRVNGSGTLWGASSGNGIAVSVSASGVSSIPQMTPDGQGGALVVWTHLAALAITSGQVYTMRLTSSGTTIWKTNGYAVTTGQPNTQANPIVTTFTYSTQYGNVNDECVLWEDSRTASDSADIYGQRIGYTAIVSPSVNPVNFDTVHVGVLKPDTIQITNVGDDTLKITQLLIDMSSVKSFVDTTETKLPLTVSPGGSVPVIITFDPLSNLPVVDTMIVSSNEFGYDSAFPVQLRGAGKYPHMQTSAKGDSVKFGNVRYGKSDTIKIELRNIGTDTLRISNPQIKGTGASSYGESDSGNASAIVIPPNDSARLSIYFTPTGPAPKNAQIQFTTNDSTNPHVILLTGTGTAPKMTFSNPSIFWGKVHDSISISRIEKIINSGTDTLHISSISLAPDSIHFTGSKIKTPVSIPPGDTVYDTLIFTPYTPVLYQDSLNLVGDDTSLIHTVYLFGYGSNSAINLSADTINFGVLAVNTSNVGNTSVTYTGTDTANLKSISITGSVNFGIVSALPIPLLPNIPKTISFKFTADTSYGDTAIAVLIIQYAEKKLTDTVSVLLVGGAQTSAVFETLGPPSGMTLGQNYPNPVFAGAVGRTSTTTIDFSSDHFVAYAELNVFDVLGRRVSNLFHGSVEAGIYHLQFNIAHLPAGMYMYELQTETGIISRELNIIR